MVIVTSTEACRKTLEEVLNDEISQINEKINHAKKESKVTLDQPLSVATVTLLENIGYVVTDTEVSWNDQYLEISKDIEQVLDIANSRCNLTLDEGEINQEDDEETDQIPTIPGFQDYKTESESETEVVYEGDEELEEGEVTNQESELEAEEDDDESEPELESEKDYDQDEEPESEEEEEEPEQEIKWTSDGKGEETESDEGESEQIFDPDETEMLYE